MDDNDLSLARLETSRRILQAVAILTDQTENLRQVLRENPGSDMRIKMLLEGDIERLQNSRSELNSFAAELSNIHVSIPAHKLN